MDAAAASGATAGFLDLLTFRAGYNTSVVILGVMALGIGGGVIGVFSFLRKRALISDAISHSTLPGIALGFLVAVWLGGNGRDLPTLMAGAAVTGTLGILGVQWIRDHTRLPEDTAIGTVLSVAFGVGIVLLSHIQTMEAGGQAGLNSFLLGSTAALTSYEAQIIGGASLVAVLAAVLLLKEFGAVAFDENFARALGWRVASLDLAMLALLLAIVAIGLKTVGLILIIAIVIIPPAAARFWTERLGRMTALSGLFGGLAGWIGAAASALAPGLPAGAVIVLSAAGIFLLSLLLAPRRGIVAWGLRHAALRLRSAETRAVLFAADTGAAPRGPGRLLARLHGRVDAGGQPTAAGLEAAAEARRQRTLWHRFLIAHPTEALAFGPLSARRIEEALPADLVAALERSA